MSILLTLTKGQNYFRRLIRKQNYESSSLQNRNEASLLGAKPQLHRQFFHQGSHLQIEKEAANKTNKGEVKISNKKTEGESAGYPSLKNKDSTKRDTLETLQHPAISQLTHLGSRIEISFHIFALLPQFRTTLLTFSKHLEREKGRGKNREWRKAVTARRGKEGGASHHSSIPLQASDHSPSFLLKVSNIT